MTQHRESPLGRKSKNPQGGERGERLSFAQRANRRAQKKSMADRLTPTAAAPKNIMQIAKEEKAAGRLRIFAGETHEQALIRRDQGNKGVRPEQVRTRQGGTVGQSTVGITGSTRSRGRKTRSGIAIA